jgi:hypothetical protein
MQSLWLLSDSGIGFRLQIERGPCTGVEGLRQHLSDVHYRIAGKTSVLIDIS